MTIKTNFSDDEIKEIIQNSHDNCMYGRDHNGWEQQLVRAGIKAVLQSPEIQALRKDAERYRRLRGMTWHSSPLCVVSIPKKSVRPGFDCPSGDRMDAAIDAAMEQQT